MRILVISDTHIPRTTNDLPRQIYDEMPRVDMIMHAGDFVEKSFYDRLCSIKPVSAVYGNMDSPALTQKLKSKEIVEVENVRIGLIHGFGAPRDLIDTVRKEFKGVNAIVYGHSHTSYNAVKEGILFFNPGSPTDKVFAAVNTYGILDIGGDSIKGSIIQLE